MKARIISGSALTALGVSLLICALGFVDGPFFYLLPFAYPVHAIKTNALVIASSSLLIGLTVLASSALFKSSAKKN